MKRIIGRGRESGDLCILELGVHMLFVLELLPHSNYIVAWVILLSLSVEEVISSVFYHILIEL